AVAHVGLEGRRHPLVEWIWRLHVVVAVNHGRGSTRGLQPGTVDDRMPGSFHDLRTKACLSHQLPDAFGCFSDIGFESRIAADAWNPQQVLELFNKTRRGFCQILVNLTHGSSRGLRCRYFFQRNWGTRMGANLWFVRNREWRAPQTGFGNKC